MCNNKNVEVEILINGNSVASYFKDGKTYIEAKDGSEYEIRIKNNHYHRILAVSSVDGLNVLTGEAAGDDDSGYVINAYNSYKIKGFRYSDDKVGAFKFSKKENSYASSKSSEAAANCGVIGVKIFEEYFTPLSIGPYDYYTRKFYDDSLIDNWRPYSSPQRFYRSSPPSDSTLLGLGAAFGNGESTCTNMVMCASLNNNVSATSFDMGSEWGASKESKVTSTSFKRGNLITTTEIYYASRESLISMGVIAASKPQVAFPKSFPKYAVPPVGWKG